MTTHREYRCDLCKDCIKPSGFMPKEGFGVHFMAGGAAVFKRVSETEHHICLQCATSVHDELRKVTPAKPDVRIALDPHGMPLPQAPI